MVLIDPEPTFTGPTVTLAGARNLPAPVQDGGVPLVLFADADGPVPSALLELAGASVDALVVRSGPDDADRVAAVRAVAARAGRRVAATEVIGVVGGGAGTEPGGLEGAVGACLAAGLDGCLVDATAPSPAEVESLGARVGDAIRAAGR